MSTKINVRSPYYLNLQEPVAPTPTFGCELANIQNLTINDQGQISTPTLDFGIIDRIESTDAAFSNGKFSTVTTATNRNLNVRIIIPDGFTNSGDGILVCDKVVSQPAYVAGTTCTTTVTTTGTIPAASLDINGGSTSINLNSYFTGATGTVSYTVNVTQANMVGISISSNTMTITSNNRAGSLFVSISAQDSTANTCTATHTFQVTVNAPAGQNFACSDAGFFGGSIAQDGTLSEPSTVATITATKSTSGGSSISSYSANNTGSDRSVTLFYDLTVPDGYTNAGSTIECQNTYTQPSSLPTFDCDNANLYGQQISRKGIINEGNASQGTIESWSPNTRFGEVSTDTPRTITFTIRVPNQSSVWANANQTITCDKTLTQPAALPTCGSNTFYISGPRQSASDFCSGVFTTSSEIVSTKTSITTALGGSICKNNAPFDGRDFYYAVASQRTAVGTGTGSFYIWQIDSQGVVLDVQIRNCPTSGDGGGKGKGGSL